MIGAVEFVDCAGSGEGSEVFLQVLFVPVAVRIDFVIQSPAVAQFTVEADVHKVSLYVVITVAIVVGALRIVVQ